MGRKFFSLRVSPLFYGCALLVAACSGGLGVMDGIMNSWEGAPIDAVIAQWGYPQQEQTIAGHKLYRWFYTKDVPFPGTFSGNVRTTGNTAYFDGTATSAETIRGDCTRTLEVNERNTVIRWEWSGNNCPVMDVPGFEYGRWRRRID